MPDSYKKLLKMNKSYILVKELLDKPRKMNHSKKVDTVYKVLLKKQKLCKNV